MACIHRTHTETGRHTDETRRDSHKNTTKTPTQGAAPYTAALAYARSDSSIKPTFVAQPSALGPQARRSLATRPATGLARSSHQGNSPLCYRLFESCPRSRRAPPHKLPGGARIPPLTPRRHPAAPPLALRRLLHAASSASLALASLCAACSHAARTPPPSRI